MLNLKFYKPLIGCLIKVKIKNNVIPVLTKKKFIQYSSIHSLATRYIIFNNKICFYTFKYKTQLNVLKQSRFQFRHTLTFNKDHT